jgi:hypothetical protein
MSRYTIYIVSPDGSKSEIVITNFNMSMRHSPINVLGTYEPVEYVEYVPARYIDVSMNALMTLDQAALLRKAMYIDNRFDHTVDRHDEHLANRPDPSEREKKLNAKRSKLIDKLLETFKDDYEQD